MSMIANLYIDQGTSYSITIDLTDAAGNVQDLTGYTAQAQIRKTYSSSTVTETFSTSITESQGKVTISLTPAQTAAIEAGRYVYDVNATDNAGTVTRIVEGQAIVTPGVTR